MKKTYLAPEVKVVKIQTTVSLLTTSLPINYETVDGDVALSPNFDILGEDSEGY